MRKKWILLLLLAMCFLNAAAQEKYDSLLNVLSEQYTQEKIYLQLDKSYYYTGETIWFKAYITANNSASLISRTLYADLINENGILLQRKIMPILQAGAASHFELADSNYHSKLYIRAYTSWMLNFDSSFLYVKPLTVINKKAAFSKIPASNKFTLTFFPEGGDLVENIACRVAFKTNNQDGIPFALTGNITDSKGQVVNSFKTLHNGMGYFTLTALPEEKYKAVWKDAIGIAHETALPEAKELGVGLKVEQTESSLLYKISRSEVVTEDFKQFTVIAQMHQQIVYAARINMRKVMLASAPIPTDSLPDGIMQITVFNAAEVPVAERIVFVNNNNYSFVTDLHLMEKNITRRGKNVLQVDVGGNLKSNLSISVTDASTDVNEDGKENIFSQLLLTTDLKGFVYQPSYYFASDEDSVKHQLDLVMMTNGWRRFNWQKVLANELPVIKNEPDNYLSIAGNIFGLSKFQLSNKMLTGILQTPASSDKSFITIPLNEDGSFKVNGVYFFDTVKLYYQINGDKNKVLTERASFSFNNGLKRPPGFAANLLSNLYFNKIPDSSILASTIQKNNLYLSQLEMKKVKTLETVTVIGKQKTAAEKVDAEYASGMFSSGNSRIFATEDDPFAQSAISVLDYLRGKVAGLEITTDGPEGGSVSRRGSTTDVFLNEQNTDISMLQSTSMTDVAMIKVFDPPFFGAVGGGAGGAVAVYTKKGRSANPNVKGLNAATLYGYSSIKEFYKPDYDNSNTADVNDFRTTLYWNPYLLMDAKNKRITIPFFNNDSAKKIRVIIEGINEQGKLTREEKILE